MYWICSIAKFFVFVEYEDFLELGEKLEFKVFNKNALEIFILLCYMFFAHTVQLAIKCIA